VENGPKQSAFDDHPLVHPAGPAPVRIFPSPGPEIPVEELGRVDAFEATHDSAGLLPGGAGSTGQPASPPPGLEQNPFDWLDELEAQPARAGLVPVEELGVADVIEATRVPLEVADALKKRPTP